MPACAGRGVWNSRVISTNTPRSYEDVGYEVRSFAPFQVEEGFPRIVSGDLRTGVSDVHYSISAAASAQFRVDKQEPDQLIKDLV